MFVFSLHYVLNFNDVPRTHCRYRCITCTAPSADTDASRADLVLVALLPPRFDYNIFNDMGPIRSHFSIQPLCDRST